MTDTLTGTITTEEVRRRSGATYRQLDYWCRIGYLKVAGEGTGVPRAWDYRELQVAVMMTRLVSAGLTVPAAARVARELAAAGSGALQIAVGIWVEVAP